MRCFARLLGLVGLTISLLAGIVGSSAQAAGASASPPTVTVGSRTASSIVLSWKEAGTASSFDVVRDGRTIASSLKTHTYIDTRVGPTTFYRYKVVARDMTGHRAVSGTVTTSTLDAVHFKVDVNGDGKADLIYIHPSTHVIFTFLSKGDGTYTKVSNPLGTSFDAASGTWTVGDVTGDGKADLVYIHPSTHTIFTFVSKGDGTYTKVINPLGSSFDAATGAWTTDDVNGDGKTDLVYIHPATHTIFTFFSKGDGAFTKVGFSLGSSFDAYGTWVTGDVNGDGRPDLVFVNPAGHAIRSFLSKGDGTYVGATNPLGSSFDAGSGTWASADLNADGKTDLAYILPPAHTIFTLFSRGDGTYAKFSFSLGKSFDAASGRWVITAYHP